MKLGIGTVQFGTNYGISNTLGQTSTGEVSKILLRAHKAGIRVLDTAAQYGNSEQVLGDTLKIIRDERFLIVTKTIHFNREIDPDAASDEVITEFRNSLARLGKTSIYGLLVHNCNDLLDDGGNYLYSRLCDLKKQGNVSKIGVSVYSPEQTHKVLDRFQIDIVQGPLSVLDQRMINSGILAELSSKNIEFHARSVFLQGLLLMKPDSLHKYFSNVREIIKRFHDKANEYGMTPLEASLSCVLGINNVNTVICGVNTLAQLEEIISAEKKMNTGYDFSEFAIDDTNIIDPSKWQLA